MGGGDLFEEDNRDLEEFRAQWQQELFSTVGVRGSSEEEARYEYQQALYYEREGQPFEAVKHYRKAFKLDPALEHSREEQLRADFLPEGPLNEEILSVAIPDYLRGQGALTVRSYVQGVYCIH